MRAVVVGLDGPDVVVSEMRADVTPGFFEWIPQRRVFLTALVFSEPVRSFAIRDPSMPRGLRRFSSGESQLIWWVDSQLEPGRPLQVSEVL